MTTSHWLEEIKDDDSFLDTKPHKISDYLTFEVNKESDGEVNHFDVSIRHLQASDIIGHKASFIIDNQSSHPITIQYHAYDSV